MQCHDVWLPTVVTMLINSIIQIRFRTFGINCSVAQEAHKYVFSEILSVKQNVKGKDTQCTFADRASRQGDTL